VIVIDTLRADRLGAYGADPSPTPFLDALAARGTVFANAYSTSSWTLPATASLFTSRIPSQHRVVHFRSRLRGEERTLAEALADGGYRGIGLTANPLIAGPTGFDQGFDSWSIVVSMRAGDGRWPPPARAGRLSAELLDALAEASAEPTRPLFVYAHYMDPHSPYDPPSRSRPPTPLGRRRDERIDRLNERVLSHGADSLTTGDAALLESLYEQEIAYVDGQLRELFASLDARSLLDDAVVVVTSDHGEELLDHGRAGHGRTLYEESVRVPLIVVAPDVPGGRTITRRVSLVDVAPTILELAGLPPEEHFAGRSLVAVMRGREEAGPDRIVLELAPVRREGADVREHARGLVRGDEKILLSVEGRTEVFDLEEDPLEQRWLDDVPPERSARLERALDRATASGAHRRSEVEPSRSLRPERTDAEKARLRALGYLIDPAPDPEPGASSQEPRPGSPPRQRLDQRRDPTIDGQATAPGAAPSAASPSGSSRGSNPSQ
jgi:arylsulfatase A-like enzyme